MDYQIILMAVIGVLGGKQLWDVISKKMSLNAEAKKAELEMKMVHKTNALAQNTSGQSEVKDLLTGQIEELKDDLRTVKEQYENAVHKITELEIKLATLKERYAEKTILHSRGSKKDKD